MMPFRMVALALPIITLASCSGPNGQAADDAGNVTAEAPAGIVNAKVGVPADFNVLDACSLIDRKIVGEVMGSPVKSATLGDQVTAPTDATAGFSNCTFELANGLKPQFFARWTPDPEPKAPDAIMKETAELFGKAAEPVPGMKQPTFWMAGPNQLHIFPADRHRYVFFTLLLMSPTTFKAVEQDKVKGWAIAMAKRAGY